MSICSDIYNIIANYLPIQDSIKLQFLCKNLFEFKMEHFIFKEFNSKFLEKHLESIERLEIRQVGKYKNLINDEINDNIISKFKKLKYLILPGNEDITDNGLEHLKGIHTLNLYCNENITDNGLINLRGIHTLNLSLNNKITDYGLTYLRNIIELDLYCNENITENGLMHVKGCMFRNKKLRPYNTNFMVKIE